MSTRKTMIFILFSWLISFQSSTFAQTVLLDTYSMWRIYNTMKPPVVEADGKLQPMISGIRWLDMHTSPAPAGWQNPEFDDSIWLEGTSKKIASGPYLSNLSMRGKFTAGSPSSAGLKITAEYYGGIAVYINGKELKRAHLPAGKITGDTLAEAYPFEAFIKENGDLLAMGGVYISKGKAGNPAPEEVERMKKRTRSIADIPVPPDMLKKGLNVIAVEIIRAPYNKVMLEDGKTVGRERRNVYDWPTCSLLSFSLSSDKEESAPNAKPKGIQIWNRNIFAGDTTADW